MVMHSNAEPPTRRRNSARDINVRPTGFWKPCGMVVREDDGYGAKLKRARYHDVRVERRFVDGAGAVDLITDEDIAAVEIKHARLLESFISESDREVVERRLPVGQDRAILDACTAHVTHGQVEKRKMVDNELILPRGTHHLRARSGKQLRKPPKLVDQFVGGRSGSAARDRSEVLLQDRSTPKRRSRWT